MLFVLQLQSQLAGILEGRAINLEHNPAVPPMEVWCRNIDGVLSTEEGCLVMSLLGADSSLRLSTWSYVELLFYCNCHPTMYSVNFNVDHS